MKTTFNANPKVDTPSLVRDIMYGTSTVAGLSEIIGDLTGENDVAYDDAIHAARRLLVTHLGSLIVFNVGGLKAFVQQLLAGSGVTVDDLRPIDMRIRSILDFTDDEAFARYRADTYRNPESVNNDWFYGGDDIDGLADLVMKYGEKITAHSINVNGKPIVQVQIGYESDTFGWVVNDWGNGKERNEAYRYALGGWLYGPNDEGEDDPFFPESTRCVVCGEHAQGYFGQPMPVCGLEHAKVANPGFYEEGETT